MIMRTSISHFVSLLLLFYAFSCAPYYVPTQTNIPLMSQVGEAQLSGSVALNSFNLNSAVTPLPHLALMYNYSKAVEDKNDFPGRQHNQHEWAAGVFRKNAEGIISELYLGYGVGSTKSWKNTSELFSDIDEMTELRADFRRYFIQINAGGSYKTFEGGGAIRIVRMDYHKLTKSNLRFTKSIFGQDVFLGETILKVSDPSAYFVEPSLTARFGLERLKLQGQLGASIPLQKAHTRNFNMYPFFASLGISVHIGRSK